MVGFLLANAGTVKSKYTRAGLGSVVSSGRPVRWMRPREIRRFKKAIALIGQIRSK